MYLKLLSEIFFGINLQLVFMPHMLHISFINFPACEITFKTNQHTRQTVISNR